MLRFAPSPTGDMHIGNLRAAVMNALISKQSAKEILIRIEDTDKERNIPGKDKEILEILNLFKIEYKEVVYQSENLPLHREKASELLEKGIAFKCYCTKEFLDEKREESIKNRTAFRYDPSWAECEKGKNSDYVIRIHSPKEAISFTDEIRGEFCIDKDEVDPFVILRADGTPTYNMACAVDDMLYNITYIIRGEDHLSNTPKQIHIQHSLGYTTQMRYAHLPIILNDEGKKMSKRDNASSVKWLLEEGFLPEAIANYLLLLGNSMEQEVFTLDEAATFYNIQNISKAPAKFDLQKLRFINRGHIKKIDAKTLAQSIGVDEKYSELVEFFKNSCSTKSEIKDTLTPIFSPKTCVAEFEKEFGLLKNTIQLMVANGEESLQDYTSLKESLIAKTGLKGKNLFKPLRYLLTNSEHGAELGELYPYIKNHLKEIVS